MATSSASARTPNEIYWQQVKEEGERLLLEASKNPLQPVSGGSVFITTISGPGAGRCTEAVPKNAAQATLAGLQRLSTVDELRGHFDEQDRRRNEYLSKSAGIASRSL